MDDSPVIVVSGLPRSGTSMMMQMLEAGGIAILTDRVREADEDNPKGYYELEAVKQTKADATWLEGAGGKAVKLVSKLLCDLPADRQFKVIFMRRDMGEMLASQRAMLERSGGGQSDGFDDAEMARIFEAHVHEVLAWLGKQSNVQFLEVWHGEALEDPQATATKVAELLGGELDTAAMAAAVDGRLYRNRAKLTVSSDDFLGADEEGAAAQRLRDLGYL